MNKQRLASSKCLTNCCSPAINQSSMQVLLIFLINLVDSGELEGSGQGVTVNEKERMVRKPSLNLSPVSRALFPSLCPALSNPTPQGVG